MDRLSFAKIDDTLFRMIKDDEKRKSIITILLNTYFADNTRNEILKIHHINIGAYRYAEQLELLAAEPFKKYHTDNEDPSIHSWQKIQQRKQGFGLKVRTNYDHRCAVCRSKVITPNGESLVEGAHIIPWSESKNDDPRNGLALCKSHHWMFDMFLLTVRPDYRVKISSWLKKESEQIENTLGWDQKEIFLPTDQRFLPNKVALKDHYEKFKSVG
jgi:putative restriction endonuclease